MMVRSASVEFIYERNFVDFRNREKTILTNLWSNSVINVKFVSAQGLSGNYSLRFLILR